MVYKTESRVLNCSEMARKLSSKKEEIGYRRFFFAVFFLIFVAFLWCSSTIIISGSIINVCLQSRNLIHDPYCLSLGGQPIDDGVVLPFIDDSSNTSAVLNSTQETPLPDLPSIVYDNVLNNSSNISFVLHTTQNRPLPSDNLPSSVYETLRISTAEEMNEGVQSVTQLPAASSPVIPSSLAPLLPASRKSLGNEKSEGSTKEVLTSALSEGGSIFTKPLILEGIDRAKAVETANSRKAVEGQIEIFRSYSARPKPTSCRGRGIYVYDLPPKFNKDLLAQCNEMMVWIDFCKYFSNDAMGAPIPELGKGWYNSHQFSLEPIFHNRILKHPCRVKKPENARVFYVPFYGAIDMIRTHFANESDKENNHVLSQEIVEWLKQQKMWKRNSGSDHVFVLGKISWDFRRTEDVAWGSPLLELEELQNPIKLIIERQPWSINEVGIPYPTYFHPSSDRDIIAWQKVIRLVNRTNLISFAGTPHKRWESIRSILIEQCSSAPKVCNFLNCIGESCVESAIVEKLFMESEFCLQPPGDSPTRKSMFDALIAGCIPVVFDPFTAHYQYPWHFPEDHTKYSVFIEQDEVKVAGVNVMDRIQKISRKKRQEMRKYIIDELMPRIIYANGDAKLEKFEDAITISVNNLLEMVISRVP